MNTRKCALVIAAGWLWVGSLCAGQPAAGRKYFAHEAVEDRHGVIASWYGGQNGQCDFRVRIAAETLKRYPWADRDRAIVPAPHFVFNGSWAITREGAITPGNLDDWSDGDLGQRSAYVLTGLADYYRYTGDPAAIALASITADYLIDHCQTPANHPWPGFFISCPVKGKGYGKCDPHGFIQLDYAAHAGIGIVAAYKLTGNPKYCAAVTHWADVLAEKCDRTPGARPWKRYANPEDVKWEPIQKGGVALVLLFLDEVIRLGHTGKDGIVLKAREAGQKYLRDVLLPEWSRDGTWGYHFWDWDNPVNAVPIHHFAANYLMNHPEVFPAWRTDVRNIVSLFLCRSSVDRISSGGVYSGAWAAPESTGCCGQSLQYPTQALAAAFARYAVLADSPWARELARRQILLTTYDVTETGVVEDNIDGGQIVAAAWFNLSHPWPLKYTMESMSWLPEILGPNRENHVMRTSSVVRNVQYGRGRIAYSTFDADSPLIDVLRLAFVPSSITVDGKPLKEREKLDANGYRVRRLSNGDAIVSIRHDGCRDVLVEGDDPQQVGDDGQMQYQGPWSVADDPEALGKKVHVASTDGAAASFPFEGNQVRLVGRADPQGGKADVYLDGVKQRVGLDCWCPQKRSQHLLYYKNGLAAGRHEIKVVARGTKNPLSSGAQVYVDAVQWSAAEGRSGFGEGEGPSEIQRVVFGYVGRKDLVDSRGNTWRPANEFVMRLGTLVDLIPKAFWTVPRPEPITGTSDPELYRYGVFGRNFTAYFTVAPAGTYYVRIKCAETARPPRPGQFAMTIELGGKVVVEDMDIAATAGGLGKAVDLVFNDVRPTHGVIAVRFRHRAFGQAMVQAIEVGPGSGGEGAKPVSFKFPPDVNLLADPGFELGLPGSVGTQDAGALVQTQSGWHLRFLGKNQGIVWSESAFRAHPQSGLPRPHGDNDALRTHAMEKDAHTQAYQEVAVLPSTAYRASVWVQPVDVRGKGFGKSRGDSAGLCIEELDAAGKLLAAHPKVALTQAAPEFTELVKTFATTPQTTKVRFILDTVIACQWEQGHVTYDDCALVRQLEPTPAKKL